MNFIQRVVGMITKPGETMKDIIAEPRVEESLLVVAAYVVLLMIQSYITISHVNIVLTDNTSSISPDTLKLIMYVFGMGGAVVLGLLLWPIITAILHLFAMVFGGEGKFYPQVLTGIGFSYVPKIFMAVILIALATQMPDTTVNVSSSGGSSGIAGAALTGTLYWAQLAVSTLFLIWSCYLGALAIKDGEKLSMNNALIVVGVPLALYLVATLGGGFLLSLI